MTTTSITISDNDWTNITTQTNFVVQNTSRKSVYFALGDLKPIENSGIIIHGGNGLNSTLVSGTLWAKAVSGSANISVTE